MLNFIGSGSAFNTKMGNNSAYIKDNNSLLLIDCGSEVFSKLNDSEIIKNIKRCYVIITHLHPDHVGSLGDLIFYNYFMNEGLITDIIYPEYDKIEELLTLQGVRREYYNLNSEIKDIVSMNDSFLIFDLNLGSCFIESHNVIHMDNINSFGYIIDVMGEKVFYSGDNCNILEEAYLQLKNNQIDKIYQDTCLANYPNNVHLNIDILNDYCDTNNIPKNKIYCMHLDDEKAIEIIKEYGFNYVNRI